MSKKLRLEDEKERVLESEMNGKGFGILHNISKGQHELFKLKFNEEGVAEAELLSSHDSRDEAIEQFKIQTYNDLFAFQD